MDKPATTAKSSNAQKPADKKQKPAGNGNGKATVKRSKDKGKDAGKGKGKATGKRPQGTKGKSDSSAPKAKRAKSKAQRKEEAAALADINLKDRKSQGAAIEYLHQWNQDRDNWKFQKVRQTVRSSHCDPR
jgi:hypothetical protein